MHERVGDIAGVVDFLRVGLPFQPTGLWELLPGQGELGVEDMCFPGHIVRT